MRISYRLSAHPPIPHYAYGCVHARRRQSAITVQDIMHYRLNADSISSALRLFNFQHACNSPSHESIMQQVQKTHSHFDRSVIYQHLSSHITFLGTPYLDLYLCLGSGAPPGGSIATHLFNASHWPRTDSFVHHMLLYEISIVAHTLASDQMIDTSSTLYVDVLAARSAHFLPECTLAVSRNTSLVLGSLLQPDMAQHVGKRGALAHLACQGANITTRAQVRLVDHRCVHLPRDVGPHLSHKGVARLLTFRAELRLPRVCVLITVAFGTTTPAGSLVKYYLMWWWAHV